MFKFSLFSVVLVLGVLQLSVALAQEAGTGNQDIVQQPDPRWQAERQTLSDIAQWARWINSSLEAKAIENHLIEIRRIIPFGRTLEGTNNRTEIKVARVVWDANRMIFLSSNQGQMSLFVGAPVSDETMKLAARNSAYLFQAKNESRFQRLLIDFVNASDRMKETYKSDSFIQQDMFNRQVMQIGKFAMVEIPLVPNMSADHLSGLITELKMRFYLTLDDIRKQELPEPIVRMNMESALAELGFSGEEIKTLTNSLLDGNNKRMSFEVIAEFKETKASMAKMGNNERVNRAVETAKEANSGKIDPKTAVEKAARK